MRKSDDHRVAKAPKRAKGRMSMRSNSPSNFTRLYIWSAIYLSLSTFLIATMVNENANVFVSYFSAFLFIVFVIQFGIVLAVCRYAPRALLGFVLIALLITLNIFSLYVVHMQLDGSTEIYAIILVFGLTLSALYWSTFFEGVFIFIIVASITLPVSSLAPLFSSASVPDAAAGGAPDTRYSGIRFNQKPNVYLISFDAMIPEKMANKYLDVENLPYERALKERGATIIKNGFVADSPSIPSLNTVMKLDDRERYEGHEYVSGVKNSPLAQIFRENGYEVETGASIPFYFGKQGLYVDGYLHAPKNVISDSTLCKFADERDAIVSAFGFCTLAKFVTTKSLFDEDPVLADSLAPYFDSEWFYQVLSRIDGSDRKAPRLGFYYIYYPIGHASNDYITNNQEMLSAYRQRFLIQAKKAAEAVVEIQDKIEQSDPNSLVLIFGDHGVKISRTVDRKKYKEFWVEDNFAVLISILNTRNACAKPELDIYNKTFSTVGRVLASVIRCLAENPDRLDRAVNFSASYNFDEYLYE